MQDQKHLTTGWKNVACSDESRFKLQHSAGRVTICHKEHDSTDLISTVPAGHSGVIFLVHFGSLSNN